MCVHAHICQPPESKKIIRHFRFLQIHSECHFVTNTYTNHYLMPVYTVVFDTSVLQVLLTDCDTANTESAFSVSLIFFLIFFFFFGGGGLKSH